MGKIFKIIVNSILVLVIILLVAYFALRAMDKIRIYNVATGSMEDKIHSGDYIFLIRKDNYQIGDVVTFTVNDYFITHRIISMKDDKITTKGDANNLKDNEITKDQIVGKAVYWGGVLNYIINYKFVIAAALVGLYLLSCYFGDGKEESQVNFEIDEDDNIEQIDENDEKNEEIETEVLEANDIKEEIKEEITSEENVIEEIIEEPIIEEINEIKKENVVSEIKPKRGRPKKKVNDLNSKTNKEGKKKKKNNSKKEN